MRFFNKAFIVCIFIASSISADGQFFNKRARYHSLGFNLNGSYFYGDVASGPKTIRPGFGMQYIYKFHPNLSFAGGFNYVYLLGDDVSNSNISNPVTANTYIRNLHFRNNVLEAFVQMRYDLFACHDHFRKRPSYNIFATAGIGVLHSDPQAKDSSGYWNRLRPMQTEGVSYSGFTAFVPISIGTRYKVSSNLDVEIELSYRFTFSDFLDDVKGNYADPDDLDSRSARYFANRSAESINAATGQERDLAYIQNELGLPVLTSDGYSYISGNGPGQARGTRIGPDAYVLMMIRLVYIIPDKGVSCPRYRD